MYIKVNVIVGAKKENFSQKTENVFEIRVKEKAQRNLANKKILELICDFYKIPHNKARIINGHHYPSKLISVEL